MKQLITTFLIFGIIIPVFAQKINPRIDQFVAQKKATISVNKSTHYLNFLGFNQGNEVVLSADTPDGLVQEFIQDYGFLFGAKPGEVELRHIKTKEDPFGYKHYYYQQYYEGIPVFGGDFRLHINPAGRLKAANGVILPGIHQSVDALITKEAAILLAKAELRRKYPFSTKLDLAKAVELVMYRDGLVQGYRGADFLAYFLVLKDAAGEVRSQVWVDAMKGRVLAEFSDVHSLISREVYNVDLGTLIWQEGDAFPGTLNTFQQSEVEAAGHTYYLFRNTFGQLSYDGADATMKTVHNSSFISCPNANWNGTSTNYCTNTGSDDVVAHEWAHAYTQYTNGLIYGWQAGALNESYSDIWGETVDLLNGYSDAGEDLSLRTACGTSDRWMMGEDASGFGGAIRDMWSPTCKTDPGKVSDGQYVCGTGDAGGVHSNSGVNNHAYALLVDGGSYNGQTITALGFTKTAHIFWRSQAFYLTNTSDFSVQAAALETACSDLVGINLEGLSTTSTPAGLSGEIITLSDCDEVAEVNLAVEFTTAPPCGFSPMLDTGAPDICGAGETIATFLFDDFESGIGSWTVTQHPQNVGSWDSRDWMIQGSLPSGRSGNAIYGPDPVIGDCAADLDNGIIRLESPMISIPGTISGGIRLSFSHYASMESKWDGGNIKYSINSGAWSIVPSANFIFNAYNDALNVSNDNPMAGEAAFTGANEGAVTGSWGESQINLTALGVMPGDNLQLRWELGTDGCNGWDGWYVDDVLVCSCEAALPVELSRFDAVAEDENIHLSWHTETEKNNLGFYLQRSLSPDKNFQEIAWIQGNGTSLIRSNYEYLDRNVKPGIVYYYRLAQMDEDGGITYSEVATVQAEASKSALYLYPNPAQNEIYITSSNPESTPIELELINLNGRVIRQVADANTIQPIHLSLTGMSPGLYVVRMKQSGQVWMEKLVVE